MTNEQWTWQPPEIAYQAAILEELRKIRMQAADQHRRLVSTLIWLFVGIPLLLAVLMVLLLNAGR